MSTATSQNSSVSTITQGRGDNRVTYEITSRDGVVEAFKTTSDGARIAVDPDTIEGLNYSSNGSGQSVSIQQGGGQYLRNVRTDPSTHMRNARNHASSARLRSIERRIESMRDTLSQMDGSVDADRIDEARDHLRQALDSLSAARDELDEN